MISKKIIAVLILAVLFAVSVVAYDLSSYSEFGINRHFHGCSTDGKIFIVYQDYRNLYASVGLITYDIENRSHSIKLIVEKGYDCIKPKVFSHNQNLLIGWLEIRSEDDHQFAYAEYDYSEDELGNIHRVIIDIDKSLTTFSFDGTNMTVASPSKEGISVWKVDVTTHEADTSTIQLYGALRGLDVEGSAVYFGDKYGGRTWLSVQEKNTVTIIANTTSTVQEVEGYANHVAWSERISSDQYWGRIIYSNGINRTGYSVSSEAGPIDLIEVDNVAYIAFNEYTREVGGDEDTAMEVKIGVISNITEPQLNVLGEASIVDGRRSTFPVLVESEGQVHVFWDDSIGDYSYWTAKVYPGSIGGSKLIVENGEMGFLITFVLAMGITMGSIFGFMFMFKGKPEKEKAKKPKKKKKKEKKFPLELRFYNRLEPYFYLKFYFAIVPFLMLAGVFTNLMATPGTSIGFRIGYGSVVNCAISLVASTGLIMLFRTEANVSSNHKIGYGFIQIAFIISLAGLLWYEVAKNSYNPYTIYFVTAASIFASSLVLIGPLILLYGLSVNRAFFVPIIPFVFIIIIGLYDFSNYSSLTFFPSVNAPTRLILHSAEFMLIFVYMIVGMLLAMMLFDALSFERLKSIKTWTRSDIDTVRYRALAMSFLIAGVLTVVGSFIVLIEPMPDLSLVVENPTLLFLFIMIAGLISMMVFAQLKEDAFLESFKKSPSKAIYGALMAPAMIMILQMVFAIFAGIFSFFVLGIYLYVIYRANNMIKYLGKDALKDAVAEEEKVEMGEEEELLVQINREDIGFIIKRDLKIMLAVPPIAAMIFLTIWKLGFVWSVLAEFNLAENMVANAGIILFSLIIFGEIVYYRGKIGTVINIAELAGLASSGTGFVLIILILFFYTISGGNVFVIISIILILQAYVLVFYATIYPPLLNRFNSESKEFFKVPEVYAQQIKRMEKVDVDMYAIPKEKEDIEEAAELPASVKAKVVKKDEEKEEEEKEEEKGVLVAKEPDDALQFRMKTFRNQGLWLAAVGALFLFGSITLWFIFPGYFSSVVIILFAIVGIVFIPIGIFLIKFASKVTPINVYDNGLEIAIPGGEPQFFPFEGYLNCRTRYIKGRKTLVLQGAGFAHHLEIWPGLEKFVEGISEKVGKDPGKMPKASAEPSAITIKNTKLLSKFSIPISILAGIGIAAMLAFMISSLFQFSFIFMVAFPIATMNILTYIAFKIKNIGARSKTPVSLNIIHVAVVFVICLIISLMPLALFSGENILTMGDEAVQEDVGSLSADRWSTDLINQTIELDNWAIIDSDILIRNCSITFNCQHLGDFGLIIKKGTNVMIIESLLEATSADRGFVFEIYGNTLIQDSEVKNVYGLMDEMNYNGGIECYEDTVFKNCTLEGSKTNGILVGGCTVSVFETDIINMEDEGIEVFDGKLFFIDSKMINCDWGLHLLRSADAEVSNCQFENCDYGLTLDTGCSAKVYDTSFHNSSEVAIQKLGNVDLSLNNVTYHDNNQDIYEKKYDQTTLCCLVMPVIITVTSFGIVVMMIRKEGTAAKKNGEGKVD